MKLQKQFLNSNNYALAIDIGATNLRFAIVDGAGNIEELKKTLTPQTNFKSELLKEIYAFKDEFCNYNIQGIGLSVAGPVENDTAWFSNLPGHPILCRSDLKTICETITILNDTSAAAFAEYIKNDKELLYLTISTGIGGSVVKIYDGNLEIVNVEPGHREINSNLDLECGCGKKNHWEAFCSGKNLSTFYDAWKKQNNINSQDFQSAKEIFQNVKTDKSVAEFIKEVNSINAQEIEKLFEEYGIQTVVFGGSVIYHNQEILLDYLKSELPKIEFSISGYGDNLSLIGAGLYLMASLDLRLYNK